MFGTEATAAWVDRFDQPHPRQCFLQKLQRNRENPIVAFNVNTPAFQYEKSCHLLPEVLLL